MPAVASRGSASANLVVRRAGGPPQPGVPTKVAIELTNPYADRFLENIQANRAHCTEVTQHNVFNCQHLALCGAGPSLRKATFEGTHQVWACNSALTYLAAQGVKNLWGVGIDQTPGLLREWSDPPDVTYLVASSCDPALIAHLLWHNRRVVFFHNAVGIDVSALGYANEFKFYCATWPNPVMMIGEGATVTSRVTGLAQWMGFERIDIYGADCCFGEGDIAHANGETVLEAYGHAHVATGEINGRHYRTRPDMLMAAVDLVRKVRAANGCIRLMGDTLPVALLGKPDDYLDLVMRRLAPGESPGETHHG